MPPSKGYEESRVAIILLKKKSRQCSIITDLQCWKTFLCVPSRTQEENVIKINAYLSAQCNIMMLIGEQGLK